MPLQCRFYAKDKKKIYYAGSQVEPNPDVDINSFVVDDERIFIGHDKKNFYYLSDNRLKKMLPFKGKMSKKISTQYAIVNGDLYYFSGESFSRMRDVDLTTFRALTNEEPWGIHDYDALDSRYKYGSAKTLLSLR